MTEINKQFDAFGADLGIKGQVIKAFERFAHETTEQLLAKSWPNEIKHKLKSSPDPIMLIINNDFDSFNPKEDIQTMTWFENYFRDPQYIYKLFRVLSRKTRNDENLFEYIKSLTSKEKFKKWLKYIELKPGAFGISINGNAILEDLI